MPGFGVPVASPTALYRAPDILDPGDWEYLSGSTSSAPSKPIAVDQHYVFRGDTLLGTRFGRPGRHVRTLDESTMAWSILPNFEPRGGENASVMDIATLDGAVYAASGGVWTSADGGSTWYRLTFGLGDRGVWSLTTLGASVFASTAAGPVFRLTPRNVDSCQSRYPVRARAECAMGRHTMAAFVRGRALLSHRHAHDRDGAP